MDFFDLFTLGEGEEVNLELMALYRRHKAAGFHKAAFLRDAAQIEGVYVPSLYEVSYRADGTIEAVRPLDGAPSRVRKRIIADMDAVYFPEYFVVPFLDIVHDRAMSEIFRGCTAAAVSVRLALFIGRSVKNLPRSSTPKAGRCAPPPAMRNFPYPPCPPATIPAWRSCFPACWTGRRRSIPIFRCPPCGWTAFRGTGQSAECSAPQRPDVRAGGGNPAPAGRHQ